LIKKLVLLHFLLLSVYSNENWIAFDSHDSSGKLNDVTTLKLSKPNVSAQEKVQSASNVNVDADLLEVIKQINTVSKKIKSNISNKALLNK